MRDKRICGAADIRDGAKWKQGSCRSSQLKTLNKNSCRHWHRSSAGTGKPMVIPKRIILGISVGSSYLQESENHIFIEIVGIACLPTFEGLGFLNILLGENVCNSHWLSMVGWQKPYKLPLWMGINCGRASRSTKEASPNLISEQKERLLVGSAAFGSQAVERIGSINELLAILRANNVLNSKEKKRLYCQEAAICLRPCKSTNNMTFGSKDCNGAIPVATNLSPNFQRPGQSKDSLPVGNCENWIR